jgi:N,N'-diacetyllegionaminate synthase
MENNFGKNNKGVFIIAEIGLNHNGDFDLAVESVKAAAETGADAVKFQNYKTEDFIFDKSLMFTYRSGGKEIIESMWDICKRCEMKIEWLPKLKKLCDELGVTFLSTPTSESGVKDLVDIGVPILKNGSDYLTHLQLLRYMGTTGKTVIISTGMADKADVQEAIDAVRSGGTSPIILMHCTSSYPTEPEDVNLNRMVALRETFCLPAGFSDHTIGSSAAVQAVSLGVCIIEKHFTLDHDLRGPDHWFSMTPSEFKQYVSDIRKAELRMGKRCIEPAEIEKTNRKYYRLSLIVSKDLPAGHMLKAGDFVITKPGLGLPPKEAENVIGRLLTQYVCKGTALQWSHFK